MLDIRPVTAADHAAWLPLWQTYQRFYQAEIPAETSALTWQRFLDSAEPMHAALAWRDGEAVGLVHFTITAVAGRVVTTATCRICSSPSTFAVAASAAR
jgi:hypothetical protein